MNTVDFNIHCVKNVQIRSFFWSEFSPNTGKYGSEKTLYLDIFHAVTTSLEYFNLVTSDLSFATLNTEQASSISLMNTPRNPINTLLETPK